jgi:hypothetical protein
MNGDVNLYPGVNTHGNPDVRSQNLVKAQSHVHVLAHVSVQSSGYSNGYMKPLA